MPCWTAFPASSEPSVGIRMLAYIVLSVLAPSCASGFEFSFRAPPPDRQQFLPAPGIHVFLWRRAQRAADPERSVTSEFVRLTVYDELHRLSCFQHCFYALFARDNLDPEAAAAPLKAEAEAAPIWRQLWVEGDAVGPP